MNIIQNEIWYDIPNYPNYKLSNLDRIKSVKRKVKHWRGSYRTIKEKILTPDLSKNGYIKYILYHKRVASSFRLHQLKALVFIPNPNNYPLVMHIDNNKSNNNVSNLKWGTTKDNNNQAWNDGLMENARIKAKERIGEKHQNHKLSDVQVKEIRQKYVPYKYSSRRLAKEYNVTQGTISYIILNKGWKHI